MTTKLLITAAAACITLGAPALAVAAECGPVEQRRAGESVEQLAARCNISVDALLDANDVMTVVELADRDAIAIPQDQAGGDWLDRAREAVVNAGREVNEAATAAGRSVSDYLKDQPDLNRDVLSFGEKVGLPGIQSGPSTGPDLEVTATDDGLLDITASGLPGDTEVTFGWLLDDGNLQPIEKLRTDERGRLEANLEQPSTIPSGSDVMFALETADRKLRLASDPISGS